MEKIKFTQITRTICPKTQLHYLDGISEDGEYYNYDTTDSYVNYDGVDIDWEIDEGYIDDFISDRISGYRDEIEDNVHLVNN